MTNPKIESSQTENFSTCTRCNGEGSVPSLDEHERARGIEDTCYHCGNTGKVDAETAYEDRVYGLAHLLGDAMVRAERDACDSDPQGEGFAFQAAENGVSLHDYMQECRWAAGDAAAVQLAKLSPEVLDALLALAKL
jgi:hypothetical protein